MVIAVIIILVVVVIGLAVYNISVYKKIETFKNINQKIVSLNIIQDFMDIIGEDITSKQKMQKLNEILIEKYEIKYSSVVVFDGNKYVMLASNVESKHYEALVSLSTEEVFKESIATANMKYITVEKQGDRLPYQKMEFERVKSAIFLPLYIDNVYIGYWIIESDKAKAFDNLDTTILEAVKQNIVSILRGVEYQNIIENTIKLDKFSELYTKEYLFGKGKKVLNENSTSTICMISVINLPDINDKHGREIGNDAVATLSDVIKTDLSDKYILVRYFGPKFVIAFPGVDVDSVTDFLQDIKNRVEEINLLEGDDDAGAEVALTDEEGTNPKKRGRKAKTKKKAVAKMKLNFVLTTYYKGTPIEGVTNILEDYIDNANKEESDINII